MMVTGDEKGGPVIRISFILILERDRANINRPCQKRVQQKLKKTKEQIKFSDKHLSVTNQDLKINPSKDTINRPLLRSTLKKTFPSNVDVSKR